MSKTNILSTYSFATACSIFLYKTRSLHISCLVNNCAGLNPSDIDLVGSLLKETVPQFGGRCKGKKKMKKKKLSAAAAAAAAAATATPKKAAAAATPKKAAAAATPKKAAAAAAPKKAAAAETPTASAQHAEEGEAAFETPSPPKKKCKSPSIVLYNCNLKMTKQCVYSRAYKGAKTIGVNGGMTGKALLKYCRDAGRAATKDLPNYEVRND